MRKSAIRIEAQPLKVKLKTTFRHAAAERNEGESVWVKADRGEMTGYGEGCPRTYVAGDDLESSVRWIQDEFSSGRASFHTFDDVKNWVEGNGSLIDKYPSAWCAVEMALLDLLAREESRSVEALLGMNGHKRQGRYTCVLPDDERWKYTTIVDRFLIRGLSDFKIKLSGDIEKDREKIAILEDLCQQHGTSGFRIRLDANNLWAGKPEEAIAHLKELPGSIFAVEEPVGPGDVLDICKVSQSVGMPVILDESLCRLSDISLYANTPGDFIVNIKISRMGGLLRSLKAIEELRGLGWPVILGCHVGETSLLTRAALIAAAAAEEALIAQEGACGDYLVEREPVEPMLRFGRNGQLGLDLPYYYKTDQGLRVVPTENWDTGLGMTCRWPILPDDGRPDILTMRTPDQYDIHYRRWGSEQGEDVLVILHGGMSHSGWQAPLANAVRSLSEGITVVAPDRRGCGLNSERGDLGTIPLVIEDVVKHVELLKRSYNRVHLAGWCQGSQYATVAAAQSGDSLSNLILLTPGFFWNQRFRDVIRVEESNISNMVTELGLEPDRSQAFFPVPMEGTDFTLSEEWLDFIENDELKLTMVTMKTVHIMEEIQEMSWEAMLQMDMPMLAVLAENDRIVDNDRMLQFYGHMFSGQNGNRLVRFRSSHAIQFEMPEETAREVVDFIRKV